MVLLLQLFQSNYWELCLQLHITCFCPLSSHLLRWQHFLLDGICENIRVKIRIKDPLQKENTIQKILNNPYFAALLSSVFVLMIGNLGTIRMFIQGVFNLGLNSLPLKSGNLFQTILIICQWIKTIFEWGTV